MKTLIAFLLCAGALCASAEEDFSLTNYFFTYAKKLDAVESLWNKFLKTPPSDEEKRQEALEEFLSEHNRTLTLQFEWFISALSGDVKNAHLSLQKALLDAHRLNLTAARAALDSALEVFDRAVVIEFNVFFMTHSTSEVGEELKKKVQATRVTATKNADTVIENYKNEGWKKYLQKDIQNLVKLELASEKLLQKITDFLKNSYPFREWLVVNYRSNEHLPYNFCLESRPFIHRYYYNDERTELLIAHAPLKRRFGSSSEANLRLSRLKATDWHWRRCHKKANDIYEDLKYSCGTKRHMAVMVLPTSSNDFSFRTTNRGFLHQRTVTRHFPVFCHHNYNALIFA